MGERPGGCQAEGSFPQVIGILRLRADGSELPDGDDAVEPLQGLASCASGRMGLSRIALQDHVRSGSNEERSAGRGDARGGRTVDIATEGLHRSKRGDALPHAMRSWRCSGSAGNT
jgi:hypothetical protein